MDLWIMDDFNRLYIELVEAMYDVDYNFSDGYPLDDSFYDIDFIGWIKATKLNLARQPGDRKQDFKIARKSILGELRRGEEDNTGKEYNIRLSISQQLN